MVTGLLTERVALPERLFVKSVAVMMAVPTSPPVTIPNEPVTLLTIATAVFDEVQFTAVVQFSEVPSVNLAVAVNFCSSPVAILTLAGVTVIELIVPPFRQLIKPSEATKDTARTKIYGLKVFIRVVSLIALT